MSSDVTSKEENRPVAALNNQYDNVPAAQGAALISQRVTVTNDSQGYSFMNYIDSSRRQTVNSLAKGDAAANAAVSTTNFNQSPPQSPPQQREVYH